MYACKDGKNHLRIYVTPQLYADAHTLTVGFVAKIRDAVYLSVLDQLRYFGDKPCLVYKEG